MYTCLKCNFTDCYLTGSFKIVPNREEKYADNEVVATHQGHKGNEKITIFYF